MWFYNIRTYVQNAFLCCTLPLMVLLLMFGIKDAGTSTTSVILCKIFWHSQPVHCDVWYQGQLWYSACILATYWPFVKRFLLLLLTHCDIWYQRLSTLQASQPLLKRFIYTTFWLLLLTHLNVWYQRFRLVSQSLSDVSSRLSLKGYGFRC